MPNRPLTPDRYSANEVIELLALEPLPLEGGYFRRTAEAATLVPALGGRRSYSLIYFLITPTAFSALHRLPTDEIWCFHAGDSIESLRLASDGAGRMVRLGLDAGAGEVVQDVVPGGVWQGSRLKPGGRWALVSCMLAPEFRWSDLVLGDRAKMVASHPKFEEEIRDLTR